MTKIVAVLVIEEGAPNTRPKLPPVYMCPSHFEKSYKTVFSGFHFQ